jgi:hypothetical protein
MNGHSIPLNAGTVIPSAVFGASNLSFFLPTRSAHPDARKSPCISFSSCSGGSLDPCLWPQRRSGAGLLGFSSLCLCPKILEGALPFALSAKGGLFRSKATTFLYSRIVPPMQPPSTTIPSPRANPSFRAKRGIPLSFHSPHRANFSSLLSCFFIHSRPGGSLVSE